MAPGRRAAWCSKRSWSVGTAAAETSPFHSWTIWCRSGSVHSGRSWTGSSGAARAAARGVGPQREGVDGGGRGGGGGGGGGGGAGGGGGGRGGGGGAGVIRGGG